MKKNQRATEPKIWSLLVNSDSEYYNRYRIHNKPI